jgi:hypothetical protein
MRKRMPLLALITGNCRVRVCPWSHSLNAAVKAGTSAAPRKYNRGLHVHFNIEANSSQLESGARNVRT